MSALVKKVLASGLVDTHLARLLEQWTAIPADSPDFVVERERVTKEQLERFVEDVSSFLGEEETAETRETMLDLGRMKWPVLVDIVKSDSVLMGDQIANSLSGMRDEMNDVYFRVQDIESEEWLTTGYYLASQERANGKHGYSETVHRRITGYKLIHLGERPVCYRVTTT